MSAPLTPLDLLRAYGASIQALRDRGIVRSKNVIGDYAEHLFVEAFGWSLEPPSNRDFDATHEGIRYQIKCRHLTAQNSSRQLGDLPEDDAIKFDVLAAVLFAEDFSVMRAALIPAQIILPLRTTISGRPRFMLRDSIWGVAGVRDATSELRAAQLAA